MNIEVKIYSCYQKTYTPVCKKILYLLYGENVETENSIKISIEDTSENGTKNIQSQRRVSDTSTYKGRIIRILENEKLKHIIGISNTNFDEDRAFEFESGKSNKEVSRYGIDGYHANSYLMQGINQILKFYLIERKKNDVDLNFYLLDTDKGVNYPNNLFNSLSYRELETIGFKILNINDIDFSEYEEKCNSKINKNNLKFASFNKFLRDIAYISNKNSGNSPSYLQCDEVEKVDEKGERTYMTERYTYIFKSLSAQQYDSLIRCWCLKKLADKEGVDIEFKLGKQYFAFDEENKKIAEELSQPVKEIFELANLNIRYETTEDFMDERIKADNTYLRYKEKNETRNQPLFRNNIRKKGIPTECVICGEDDPNLLDAAHLWEVSEIKNCSLPEINNFIKVNNLEEAVHISSEFSGEFFYKKYYLTNSGDNGVWLCKNHHRQFDLNYYYFDSEFGKVVLKFNNEETCKKFKRELQKEKLSRKVLTPLTKAFLGRRIVKFNV